MTKYRVRFQNSQDLMIIEASSNIEARREFNKHISIKQIQEGAAKSRTKGCVANGT